MRCPKCGFHSFDYLDACKKCNTDLRPYKASKTTAASPRPALPPPASATSAPAAFEPPAPAAPVPGTLTPPPPASFEVDLGPVEETKLSAFPPGPHKPAPATPSKIPEFTLDFDTPAKPASAPDLLAPSPAEESLSLLTPPPGPLAAPGRSLGWQLPAAPAPAENLLSAPRGGFWIRFAAQIVDGTILSFVLGFIFIIIFFALGLEQQLIPKPGQNPKQMAETIAPAVMMIQLLFNVLSLVFGAIYFIYFHGSRGQTPGKMILKLKVIQDNGREMTYGKATVRYLGYIINYFTFLLGFLWAAFDKDKQGLHDKIAKTLVVRLG